MSRLNHRFHALLSGAIFFLFLSSFVRADLPANEVREANNYRLSEKNLAQFKQATKNLIAAAEQNQLQVPEDLKGKEVKTLSALVEFFDTVPAAKKAVQDAGMTSRDYWLFQFALAYAAAGHMATKAGGQLPAEYSKANVDFYRAHEADFEKLQPDIQKLNQLTRDAGEDPDEESDEEE